MMLAQTLIDAGGASVWRWSANRRFVGFRLVPGSGWHRKRADIGRAVAFTSCGYAQPDEEDVTEATTRDFSAPICRSVAFSCAQRASFRCLYILSTYET
jgi:hypothetical protein